MKPGTSKPLAEKLEKYEPIPFTGCWIWYGACDKDGYGVISGRLFGKEWRDKAHRKSYEHHIGPIEQGKHILHTCDTPECINPDHLYMGDPKQNGLDKKLRGRAKGNSQPGTSNGMYGRTGALNPMFGKKHTEETKRKISETKKKVN